MTQHFAYDAPEDRSANARAIGRLIERATRAVYEIRGPRCVHQGQWAVLRFLARASDDRRTVSGVAAHMRTTHGPASRSVSTLVRKAYVTVEIDERDRRSRRIDLTPAGRDLLRQDPTQRLTLAIEVLSAVEQLRLREALATVSNELDATSQEAGRRRASLVSRG